MTSRPRLVTSPANVWGPPNPPTAAMAGGDMHRSRVICHPLDMFRTVLQGQDGERFTVPLLLGPERARLQEPAETLVSSVAGALENRDQPRHLLRGDPRAGSVDDFLLKGSGILLGWATGLVASYATRRAASGGKTDTMSPASGAQPNYGWLVVLPRDVFPALIGALTGQCGAKRESPNRERDLSACRRVRSDCSHGV